MPRLFAGEMAKSPLTAKPIGAWRIARMILSAGTGFEPHGIPLRTTIIWLFVFHAVVIPSGILSHATHSRR